MKLLLALFTTLLFACGVSDPRFEDLDAATVEQAYTGAVGTDEPLTFWWYAGNPAELRPAIECALERIRTATCLPVDVSMDAAHWVRQKTDMGGLVGQTTGTWASTRIALKTPMGPQTNCRVLVHEIAQHVLRRRNDHVGANLHMDQALLDSVCSVQDCGCMNPESDDNPVESTALVCEDTP